MTELWVLKNISISKSISFFYTVIEIPKNDTKQFTKENKKIVWVGYVRAYEKISLNSTMLFLIIKLEFLFFFLYML